MLIPWPSSTKIDIDNNEPSTCDSAIIPRYKNFLSPDFLMFPKFILPNILSQKCNYRFEELPNFLINFINKLINNDIFTAG